LRKLLSVLKDEIRKTLKRPWRVLAVFSKSKRRLFAGHIRATSSVAQSWLQNECGFRREYTTYEEYLTHQISELEHHDLTGYDISFRESLRERLEKLNLRRGMSVLCLAARIGTEVKAFLDLGFFAVGIDINPRKKNRYVLYGDFHKLQFASNSIDVVYTNSIDHVFDMKLLMTEIKRVLKQDGLLILETSHGESKGCNAGVYESFWYKDVEDLVEMFEGEGFCATHRQAFDIPWPGEMICFSDNERSEC